MAGVDSFFVVRTMQALEVLAFEPSSAPQVAEVLRVDARTARRLLNRLADEGWLVRSEGRVRTYTLSLRLVALAAHFLERSPLAHAANAAVRELHARTGGVAHLTIPSYRSVLCLAQEASGPHSRPHFRELIPAHASAGGKVLLAHREPWRESVLELPLERLTEHTIVDPDAVRSECEITLARGFAFEDREYRDGIQTVAVPVPDRSGSIMAAVALAGPPELEVATRIDAVATAAGAVGEMLADDAIADAA
jgi:IclR family transcriptional regulator, acetate operon repressor